MNKFDLYKILGLDETADDSAVESAYSALKAQYYDGMFTEGDQGAAAAENLTKLEHAYAEIKRLKHLDSAKVEYGSDLGIIDAKIIAGKIEEAQRDLDACVERSAEWHFLQAVVYYKRNWLSESKKHLKLAVAAEPQNIKYSNALRNLEHILNAPEIRIAQQQGGGLLGPRDDAMGMGNNCTLCPLCLLPICCCR